MFCYKLNPRFLQMIAQFLYRGFRFFFLSLRWPPPILYGIYIVVCVILHSYIILQNIIITRRIIFIFYELYHWPNSSTHFFFILCSTIKDSFYKSPLTKGVNNQYIPFKLISERYYISVPPGFYVNIIWSLANSILF